MNILKDATGKISVSVLIVVFVLSSFVSLTVLSKNQVVNAQNSGATWTTYLDCGSGQQDINQFFTGDNVYIHGSGFAANTTYEWAITGQPGGASGDPNIVVAPSSNPPGTITTDANGDFCFLAYTIPPDDWGTYDTKVGNKGDNYRVTQGPRPTPTPPGGASPTPTMIPPSPTNVPPTATPTVPVPTNTVAPTATPTVPAPTNTPTVTPSPTGPTVTPGRDTSSIKWISGCTDLCLGSGIITANFQNVGGDMQTFVEWRVYYSATGNPKPPPPLGPPSGTGVMVHSGTLQLDAGEDIDLDYTPTQPGRYIFMVFQVPTHNGQGVVWSSDCTVRLCASGTPTVTPSPTIPQEPTSTPTPTMSPSPTPTGPTSTPSPTPTGTITPTSTLTPSPTPTSTPGPTATPGPGPTATPVPGPTATPVPGIVINNVTNNSTTNNNTTNVTNNNSSTSNSTSNSTSTATGTGTGGQVLGASTGRGTVTNPVVQGLIAANTPAQGDILGATTARNNANPLVAGIGKALPEGDILGASTSTMPRTAEAPSLAGQYPSDAILRKDTYLHIPKLGSVDPVYQGNIAGGEFVLGSKQVFQFNGYTPTVMYSHNDGTFAQLSTLRQGDKIFHDVNGQTTEYTVDSIMYTTEDNVEILKDHDIYTMVLVTCFKSDPKKRVVVVASKS